MLRSFSLALLGWTFGAGALSAALIRGNVVENQSGKALARAVITLSPVTGTRGGTKTARANGYGAFTFESLAPGAYVLKASKRGFIPMEYGQKRWNSAGLPISLTSDASPFVTIRLPRYGAITGTIVDENDVGLSQQGVLAYRDTRPPEIAGRAIADDRGVFRIGGLEPGAYLVRSAAGENDGVEYLPTFSKETLRVEEARVVEVYEDQETQSENLRAVPGQLFTLSGTAVTVPQGIPVTVTLASDMGRQTVQGPNYQFQSLAPGPYELYAEAPENKALNAQYQAAFTPVNLSRNQTQSLTLLPVRESQINVTPSVAPTVANSTQLLVRSKDLAGTGPTQAIEITNNRALLAPGRWDLSLVPPSAYYVSGFSSGRGTATGKDHPDAWNEIAFNNFTQVSFSLSAGPGSLHGNVKNNGDLIPGAPVYLEAYDPATRQRVADLRITRTDLQGNYRFDGLAPGTYRVLATFEYQSPDPAALDLASAPVVKAEPRTDLQMDLDLYNIR
jgi:protocatechuate 3,4-dioxygenase beta subunit